MRIVCLPKLISYEETAECTLKNCSVVIDGHNFLNYTYEESKIPFVFGCEANQYAKYLRNRLVMFKKANVKCYIVIKGGDMDIEKKIQKLKAKQQQRTDFNFATNYAFVPPVFTKDIALQVLDEIGINYAVCVAESKDECVALALKLRCPLISFDIEYCFKKAPYVPHLTMKYNARTNSIHCGQYILQNFLQKHSLTQEKAAIFAALSDTQIFPQNFFDSVFQSWDVLDDSLYDQLKKLILWLSKHSDDEARKGILKTLSNDGDNHKFQVYYDNILKGMQKDEAGIVSKCLLDSEFTILLHDPMWFEKGVALKNIAPVYINLYKWNVIEGSWAIEDKNSDDSILLSIDIIKYAHNLLTNFKGGKILLYQNVEAPIEIDAVDPHISKPRYSCKESVFENGWSHARRFNLFEHFLSKNQIKTEILNKLPVEATVLFIALVYFARKKKLNGVDAVDLQKQVYSNLISYVVLNVVFDKEGSYKKINNDISEADCQEAARVTASYFKLENYKAAKIFNGKLLKSFAELQFCMKHMNYLNTLCGSSYKPIRLHRVHNGTFIYQMFCDMQKQDTHVFINDTFGTAPSVLKLIKKMIKCYEELI